MTVNYNFEIATSKPKVIVQLLWRWKGSIWKAVSLELVLWIIAYGIISCIYRFALSADERKSFEHFAEFCNNHMNFIPMNFMLGFFVTIIIGRWVTIFTNLGMIDNIALFTSNHVSGRDERSRNVRRNVVRYCCLAQALVFRDINLQVRNRFPTMETLVAAGFMMDHELQKFNSIKNRYAKYWVPFNWSLTLLHRALKEGQIHSDITMNAIAQEIRNFRSGLSLIWTYDWIPIPVMYPQLVFLAVHTYFLVALISRQFIVSEDARNKSEFDLIFPFMSCLEFVFYMGWMKVAMALLNPMGEDDDDFECNFLLDRNLTLSLTCVDEGHDDPPEVLKDVFWEEESVQPLYSSKSAQKAVSFHMGSVADNATIPDDVTEVEMIPHPINEHHEAKYQPHGLRRRRTSIVSIVPQENENSRSRTPTGIFGAAKRRLTTLSTGMKTRSSTRYKKTQPDLTEDLARRRASSDIHELNASKLNGRLNLNGFVNHAALTSEKDDDLSTSSEDEVYKYSVDTGHGILKGSHAAEHFGRHEAGSDLHIPHHTSAHLHIKEENEIIPDDDTNTDREEEEDILAKVFGERNSEDS